MIMLICQYGLPEQWSRIYPGYTFISIIEVCHHNHRACEEDNFVTLKIVECGHFYVLRLSYFYARFRTPKLTCNLRHQQTPSLSIRHRQYALVLAILDSELLYVKLPLRLSQTTLETNGSHKSPKNLRKLSCTPTADQFEEIKSHAPLPYSTISISNTTSFSVN